MDNKPEIYHLIRMVYFDKNGNGKKLEQPFVAGKILYTGTHLDCMRLSKVKNFASYPSFVLPERVFNIFGVVKKTEEYITFHKYSTFANVWKQYFENVPELKLHHCHTNGEEEQL